jgi:hypothetical protein
LVEQQDAVVLQRARQPRRRARRRGPRRLAAGPALEEDEQRPVACVLRSDLAREDRYPVAVRTRVVERNRELVVRDREPVDLARRRHA